MIQQPLLLRLMRQRAGRLRPKADHPWYPPAAINMLSAKTIRISKKKLVKAAAELYKEHNQ